MLSGTVHSRRSLSTAARDAAGKAGPFPFRRAHRPSGTAGMGAELIGVPGANERSGPPTTIPAGSFSTNLGLHGPEINISAITAKTTKAAIIGQLILLISTILRSAGILTDRGGQGSSLPRNAALPTPLPSPRAAPKHVEGNSTSSSWPCA